MIAVSRIDHIAITVADLDRAVEFYVTVLEAEPVRDYEIDGRRMVRQLRIGGAMMNLHQAGHGHWLVAGQPTPGSADVCFGWGEPIGTAVDRLRAHGVAIVEGPVERYACDGAAGLSVYFRDADDNLLELLSTREVAAP